MGIADRVVREYRPAHEAPEAAADATREALVGELTTLAGQPIGRLLSARERRYENVGSTTGRFGQWVSRRLRQAEPMLGAIRAKGRPAQ
jgi:hypothetical protein